MTPLITVAIPTRNRQLCAATLVRAALELIPDCQVVVNDNSDDDSLGALLGDMVSDPRLSYCYQPDNLSVVENFNNALARSTGEYITFLGDDDMIGPRFREFVLKAKAAGIDALLYRTDRRPLHYFWPGVSSPRWGDMGGKLYFSRYTGRGHDLDIQWASRDAIAHLGTGPRRMPRIYLGVISRKLVERAEATFGPLFGGFSPDVYSSHLLARCCAKPVVVDYPLIIPGASPKSTSAARAERSDVGGLTANDHIGRFVRVDWDERIPKYYSPYTVWAQTHVKAHTKTGDSIPVRAFAHLYASCLIFTPRQALQALPNAIRAHGSVSKMAKVILRTAPSLVAVLTTYALEKVPALLTRRPGGARFEVSGAIDARRALRELENRLGAEIPEFCR